MIKKLASYSGHKGSVLAVSHVSIKEKDYVFSGGEEDIIRVWDLNGNLLRKIKVPAVSAIQSLGFLSNGENGMSIVVGSPNGIIQVLDVETEELIVSIRHRGLKAMSVSQDHRVFISGGLEGSIVVRDHQTGSVVSAGGLTDVYSLSVLEGAPPRIVSCGNENIINVWDGTNGDHVGYMETVGPVYAISAVNIGRSRVAAGGRDKVIRVYAADTPSPAATTASPCLEKLGRLVGHEGVVLALAVLPLRGSISLTLTAPPTLAPMSSEDALDGSMSRSSTPMDSPDHPYFTTTSNLSAHLSNNSSGHGNIAYGIPSPAVSRKSLDSAPMASSSLAPLPLTGSSVHPSIASSSPYVPPPSPPPVTPGRIPGVPPVPLVPPPETTRRKHVRSFSNSSSLPHLLHTIPLPAVTSAPASSVLAPIPPFQRGLSDRPHSPPSTPPPSQSPSVATSPQRPPHSSTHVTTMGMTKARPLPTPLTRLSTGVSRPIHASLPLIMPTAMAPTPVSREAEVMRVLQSVIFQIVSKFEDESAEPDVFGEELESGPESRVLVDDVWRKLLLDNSKIHNTSSGTSSRSCSIKIARAQSHTYTHNDGSMISVRKSGSFGSTGAVSKEREYDLEGGILPSSAELLSLETEAHRGVAMVRESLVDEEPVSVSLPGFPLGSSIKDIFPASMATSVPTSSANPLSRSLTPSSSRTDLNRMSSSSGGTGPGDTHGRPSSSRDSSLDNSMDRSRTTRTPSSPSPPTVPSPAPFTTSPPSCLLISGSADKTVRVWDLDNLVALHVLRSHTGAVTCLCVGMSPAHVHSHSTNSFVTPWVLSGSFDGTMVMWGVETEEEGDRGYGLGKMLVLERDNEYLSHLKSSSGRVYLTPFDRGTDGRTTREGHKTAPV